ncbi:hypothetical protein PoB_004408000 [Plakobranchus ocellatus]|uniref:Uncharacterized protein n=1 Tax=Plakobranchus ocellatus TaxID=259542 RepID=A0AAV4BAE1_9GAST|nr:hypothetical protein PoB_004408000 [Plakobranchus ocellatus]
MTIYISAVVHFLSLGSSRSTFLQWSDSSVLVCQDLHFCSGPIPLPWSVRIYISAVVQFLYLGLSGSTFLQWSNSSALVRQDLHLCSGPLLKSGFITIYISAVVQFLCLGLESKPSRRLRRLVKERPMLKVYRQKLMLRDKAEPFLKSVKKLKKEKGYLVWSISTVLDISIYFSAVARSSVLVRQDLHFCRGPSPLSWSVRIYISAVVYFHYLGTSRYTFLQWPDPLSWSVRIYIYAVVQFLCPGPSGSTFLKWSNSSVLVRQDLHFCSGPIPLSRFITIHISAVVFFYCFLYISIYISAVDYFLSLGSSNSFLQLSTSTVLIPLNLHSCSSPIPLSRFITIYISAVIHFL